jgi:protein-disulfide isomerase
VLFAFRHLPLTGAHPFALQAARVAECGRRQNRFWEMHDLLFRDGARLATDALAETASRVGVSREQLEGCIQTEGREAVESDLAQARSLGIRGTPAFLFGTSLKDGRVTVLRRQSGVLSPDAFSDIVASLQRDRAAR